MPVGDLAYGAKTAVTQDALIYCLDVDDYVSGLEETFGPIVREIPWLLYTDQTSTHRGCLPAIPFLLVALARLPLLLIGKPVIPGPDPRNFGPRLTLGHIAYVIDQGYWTEP